VLIVRVSRPIADDKLQRCLVKQTIPKSRNLKLLKDFRQQIYWYIYSVSYLHYFAVRLESTSQSIPLPTNLSFNSPTTTLAQEQSATSIRWRNWIARLLFPIEHVEQDTKVRCGRYGILLLVPFVLTTFLFQIQSLAKQSR